ncbi:hypothetical protein [Paludibacter jiangxiensis]|uniref:DUF5672 domain-containing protein n=1 Tax=Paludibacter jiangxiensis TaxID=681398 RepID=A0A171A3A9_9BACT|nr:hypothetical protein [Paludibacter jiangxiensis]GAT63250.1 hypothetical protein PJIAN_3567 [Paludibacter jiangxiensis]
MKTAICTLYEGHYHYGVAALSNSLYKNGFRGSVYVGYRGELPFWAANAKEDSGLSWNGARTLEIGEGLKLHFLPLITDYHFTNYKPDFMLELWDGPAKDAQSMFYFDPDIVVCAPWKVFESWAGSGIALCEDVNSPLHKNHPKRIAWRNYFSQYSIALTYKESAYVNGGFVGLEKEEIGFLHMWKQIQEAMAVRIGGLNRSALTNSKALSEEDKSDFAPFSKTDQDALNATVEAWSKDASIMGQEAMAFKSGARMMSHALGIPKPWDNNIILSTLKGYSPSVTLKDYWKCVNGPIYLHSKRKMRFKVFEIQICAFIGRFYRRR